MLILISCSTIQCNLSDDNMGPRDVHGMVILLFRHLGQMTGLHYSSIRCTGHGNFHLSDSTIQLDYRSGYRCSM